MVAICVFHYHLFVARDMVYILNSLVLETRLVQSLFLHLLLSHHRVLGCIFSFVPQKKSVVQVSAKKSVVQESVQQAQQLHLTGEGRKFTHELGQPSIM